MAIRITGMYSGLDTESIINELASAQSAKKNKLVKAQTKLSWKQDAWKSLNTKIYSFYQKLDDLRLQSSYLKKKTTVSNTNALTVSGGTMDGTHKVKVEQLSRQASITSGSLAKNGTHYTGNATLKQLGFSGSGSIRLSDAAGNYVDVNVDENMKINDFVKAINNNTALKANFDQDNQRIYLSSWASGKEGEFFLTGNNAGGTEALKALKLLSSTDLEKLTAAGGEYDVWSKYLTTDLTSGATPPAYPDSAYTADYKKVIEEETLRRLKALKAENDKLAKENENCDKANQMNLNAMGVIDADKDGEYTAHKTYLQLAGYDSTWDKDDASDQAEIKAAAKILYDKIYGTEDTTKPVEDDKGQPVKDKDGNPVYERTGGLTGELKTLQDTLKDKQDALKQARDDLAADSENAAKKQAVKDAEDAVAAASKDVSDKKADIKVAQEVYSVYSAFNDTAEQKKGNLDKIAANNAQFDYNKDENGKETYQEKDAAGNAVAIGQGETSKAVAEEFNKRVLEAQKIMKDVRQADGTLNTGSTMLADAQGTKVEGEDAKIVMDGVTYTSSTDTLTINGVTLTALEKTDKEVTVSTKTDTDGVYDMIKDFVKAYSDLMIEMDTLYNAESSKGYEPLTSEEKDALTDTEVEEWEKKIKDSLLRRDSTLSDVSSAMRMDMMMTMNIGGRSYSLADFGIETQSYFKAKDNERNAYHILGDKDDPLSWEQESGKLDLRGMISKEPDKVIEFFTKLSNNLHDTIAEKMSPSKMSSALTVYNDKKMKEDYDDYTKKIKTQEEKLNAYIDKWYAKFSAMETALAKLESKNSSLSSLFGG